MLNIQQILPTFIHKNTHHEGRWLTSHRDFSSGWSKLVSMQHNTRTRQCSCCIETTINKYLFSIQPKLSVILLKDKQQPCKFPLIHVTILVYAGSHGTPLRECKNSNIQTPK